MATIHMEITDEGASRFKGDHGHLDGIADGELILWVELNDPSLLEQRISDICLRKDVEDKDLE